MTKLIMMRHGESQWNKRNLFTGWVDVPLSPKGIEEALEAGKRISQLPVDIIITSTLIRAQMTALLAMSVHHSGKVPVIQHNGEKKLAENSQIFSTETLRQIIPVLCSWELNERMYGELQGLDKAETAEKFGADQVKIWRRSYDVPPPKGESLEMTAARAIPYFKNTVVPLLQAGKNVLISAHGNSLRSVIMYLDNLSKDEVLHLELATGAPLAYEFHDNTFKKLGYL